MGRDISEKQYQKEQKWDNKRLSIHNELQKYGFSLLQLDNKLQSIFTHSDFEKDYKVQKYLICSNKMGELIANNLRDQGTTPELIKHYIQTNSGRKI